MIGKKYKSENTFTTNYFFTINNPDEHNINYRNFCINDYPEINYIIYSLESKDNKLFIHGYIEFKNQISIKRLFKFLWSNL